MTVTSHQVTVRTGCNSTELKRLRDILGVPSQGSGRHLEYDDRLADVLVTLWLAMLDFGRINRTEHRRQGMTWSAYGRLGRQLLCRERAVLESGVVRVEVRLVRTDWERVPTGERTTRNEDISRW